MIPWHYITRSLSSYKLIKHVVVLESNCDSLVKKIDLLDKKFDKKFDLLDKKIYSLDKKTSLFFKEISLAIGRKFERINGAWVKEVLEV